MATYKTVQESALSPSFLRLTCDICGSADIVDTTEGYVCRECGIVLTIQKLQYDRPYNDDIIQYAKGLGRTHIGTLRERSLTPDSKKIQRLNRHNLTDEYINEVYYRAQAEISRIFSCLELDDYEDIKGMAFLKFKTVRPKLRARTKYRNVEKLVAIISYFCFKLRNISVNDSHIIQNSLISKKEFNDFYQQVRRYIPESIFT